jgi:VWFA-related protein
MLLGALSSLSGQAPSAPEITSQEAPVTFSSRVNLVSVPVVVRDREGRAMGNLRQEDFQLFDKSKLQVITKFSIDRSSIDKTSSSVEVAPGAPNIRRENTPAPVSPRNVLPERYIAYLVDDVHLDHGDLLNARQAMHRHLDQALDPTSRAAIFTTSGVILADFTADREKLHDAVNKLQPYTSGIDRQMGCPYISHYLADLWVNKELYLDGRLFPDPQLLAVISSGTDQALTAAYGEAQGCVACSPGTDHLTGLPLCAVTTLTKLRDATRQALTFGDHETSLGLGALNDVIRKLSVMPGNRNLVLVSPGFLLTRDHRTPEYDMLDRAIRANVVINTIDMRGLFTIVPGGHASEPYSSLEQYERGAATQADDVLAELADGTGGRFFHNDNALKEGLNLLAARPEYVYVLGFSPQNLKFDGSYHNLKVTVRNASDTTLQVRRGYWAPNHAVDPAEQAREEIRETVFSRDEIRDIPVDLQTEFFKLSQSKAELTVNSHLDAKTLRFRKAEDRNDDTLTVVTGLFDPNGNYVVGIERLLQLRLRDQTLEVMRNAGISVKETFDVAPGRYLVRVVVRDQEGSTMAARNGSVEIP